MSKKQSVRRFWRSREDGHVVMNRGRTFPAARWEEITREEYERVAPAQFAAVAKRLAGDEE